MWGGPIPWPLSGGVWPFLGGVCGGSLSPSLGVYGPSWGAYVGGPSAPIGGCIQAKRRGGWAGAGLTFRPKLFWSCSRSILWYRAVTSWRSSWGTVACGRAGGHGGRRGTPPHRPPGARPHVGQLRLQLQHLGHVFLNQAAVLSVSPLPLSLSVLCTCTHRVLKSFYFGAAKTSLFKAVNEIYQDARI